MEPLGNNPLNFYMRYINLCDAAQAIEDQETLKNAYDEIHAIFNNENQYPGFHSEFRDNDNIENIKFNLRVLSGKIQFMLTQISVSNERAYNSANKLEVNALSSINAQLKQEQQQTQNQGQIQLQSVIWDNVSKHIKRHPILTFLYGAITALVFNIASSALWEYVIKPLIDIKTSWYY